MSRRRLGAFAFCLALAAFMTAGGRVLEVAVPLVLGLSTQFPPLGQAHTPGVGEVFGPALAPYTPSAPASINWSIIAGRPSYMITPNGPTDGGDFGPNTPGTHTFGWQEALNAIATTGGVIAIAPGAYTLSHYVYYTGSNQLVYLQPGATITAPTGSTLITPGTFGGGTNYPGLGPRLIHMGSDPISTTVNTIYNFNMLIGFGATISIDLHTSTHAQGIAVWNPGQNSSVSYSGPGGYGYVVMGFNYVEVLPNAGLMVMSENYNVRLLTTAQRMGPLLLADIHASTTSNAPAGHSMLYVTGASMGVCERCDWDCSNVPGGTDYDPMNLTGSHGEAAYWTFVAGTLKGNGLSGQVFELQGASPALGASNTGGCHDNTFTGMIFDSGAANGNPGAGSGGAYFDDNDTNTSASTQVYNITFNNCRWIHVGATYKSQANTITLNAGTAQYYAIFNGAAQAPITIGGNTYGAASNAPNVGGDCNIAVSVTGGTVTTIGTSPQGETTSVFATGKIAGLFILAPGDYLLIHASAVPTVSTFAFGYIRYNGNAPVTVSGTLTGRGPGGSGGYIGVGPSVFTFTNNFGQVCQTIVTGGTLTSMSLNGSTVATSDDNFFLWPLDTIGIGYSVAPTVVVQVK